MKSIQGRLREPLPNRLYGQSLKVVATQREEAANVIDGLENALKQYQEDYCEGWCAKGKLDVDLDCGGCLARTILASPSRQYGGEVMKWLVTLKRMVGIRCHRWKATHTSGYIRKCQDCGEEQQAYELWWTGPKCTWWETTSSGNGSCGTKELPTRVY